MTLQGLLQTLKTAKRTYPNSVYNLLHCCSYVNTSLNLPKHTFSDVDLSTFHQILSDRDIKSWRCVSIFHLVLENPSVFSFQPDLKSHLSLTLRILSERKFSDAERLLKLVAVNDIKRYQFRCIASEIDEFCCDKRVVARFFNSMLMVYSDSEKFDEVLEVFEYMMNKDIKICERICTTHLMKLKECNHMESAIDFFHQMLGSGIEVSVYPLTVIVTALCCNGEITRARELVEEMLLIKGIKPNIITFKSMIDSCTKRWNFEELDLVLRLMEKEDVRVDLDTYKVLIEGYASNGKFEEVERLVSKMHDEELKVETYLYNRIINGYSRLGVVEKAFEVHSRMSGRGVTPNRDTYWALMNGLCRAGKVNEALSFLSELRANEFEIDDAMFTTLIEGCYREGMISKALEVIGEMIREGFIPDATLLQKLADRLVEVNRTEAELMVTVMVKNGIRPKSCPN